MELDLASLSLASPACLLAALVFAVLVWRQYAARFLRSESASARVKPALSVDLARLTTGSTTSSSPSDPSTPDEWQLEKASPSEALLTLISRLRRIGSKQAIAPVEILDKLSALAIDQKYAELERSFATARQTDMPVLVTGATGFVGNYLVRSLLRQGRKVRVLVLSSDRAGIADLADQLEVHVGDITSAEDVHRAVAGVHAVFHLASLVSLLKRDLEILARVNVLGTQNVVDACLAHGVGKLLYVGSIHALAALPEAEPISETRPLAIADERNRGEISPYDLTKAMAEQAVIDALPRGLNAIRITPVGIWGPGDRLPSLLGRFLLQLWCREHLLVPAGGFHFVDVRDVVHGCLKAEEYGQVGKRYLLKGHHITMPALAGRVHAVTGESRPWTPAVPMWMALASAHVMQHFTGDSIGFNPSSIRPFLYHQQVNDDETQAALRGLDFRPVDVTLRDTFDDFLKMGYCARGGKAKSQWGGLNCRRDELPARSRSSSAAPLAAEAAVH